MWTHPLISSTEHTRGWQVQLNSNAVVFREPEYMCRGCRGKLVLGHQIETVRSLSAEELARVGLCCSYRCAEVVLEQEPGATVLMGLPVEVRCV